MTQVPLAWLRLTWPRELSLEQHLGALAVLATSGQGPTLVSSLGTARLVTHDLAIAEPSAEHLAHQLSGLVPGLSITILPAAPVVEISRAIEVRLSTRQRALATTIPEASTRSILAALANVHAGEHLRLLWWLGGPLRPTAVSNNLQSLPSDSWLKDLALAPFVTRRTIDPEARNALRAKQSLPGWKTMGYIGVKADGRPRQRQLIGQVLAALRTLEAPGVAFWVRSSATDHVAAPKVPWRHPLRLNVAEVALLSSWPLGPTNDLPITAQRSKLVAPRAPVPSRGRVIGEATYPGVSRPLAMSINDSLRHTWVLGPSGVGKSTLLAHLIERDMKDGRAVIVAEPKVDLIAQVLTLVPAHRLGDVVLLDPKDLLATVGLNPLEGGTQHPEIVADQILAVFQHRYGQLLGTRTTDILSVCLHTLARIPGATLVGLPLLLTDANYRRRCLAQIDDPIAIEPFWSAFEAWSDAARTEAIAPLLNKIRPLLLRPQLRAVLGQAHPRFSMRDIFTQRKILLVDCSKGELGPETSALLGSLVVALAWSATLERTAIAPALRHPVSVVLDEFQEYLRLPTDLGDALAQARGLGVGFTIANQYIHQLDPAMRSAVMANVQNKICFHLADEDAKVMATRGSGLDPEDFANLGAYEFYAQLVADSTIQPWCSGRSLPPSPPTSDPKVVRDASRQRYGRPRAEVEAELRALVERPARISHDDLTPRPRRGGTS